MSPAPDDDATHCEDDHDDHDDYNDYDIDNEDEDQDDDNLGGTFRAVQWKSSRFLAGQNFIRVGFP